MVIFPIEGVGRSLAPSKFIEYFRLFGLILGVSCRNFYSICTPAVGMPKHDARDCDVSFEHDLKYILVKDKNCCCCGDLFVGCAKILCFVGAEKVMGLARAFVV